MHTRTLPVRATLTGVCAALALVWLFQPSTAAAEQSTRLTVTGRVRTADGQPVEHASITIGDATTTTEAQGAWTLQAAPGRQRLIVKHDGFADVTRDLDVSPALGRVDVTLNAQLTLREDVVVRAVRATDEDPVTKTNVSRAELQASNRGQEMPFVLGRTPSVTFQSDSGAAAGYAYFTIRGIGQTRLNVTLDGIPLQDPEDSALYFSNFGDFASVVDSVQVQRGIGTSTVGAASYGGSVNFASVNPGSQPSIDVQTGGGSWGTARGTLGLHSGQIAGGFALYGRVSGQTSDGFRDHSSARQRTVYFGATRQDGRSLFKLFGFSGRTKTQLAFWATDTDTLTRRLRTNTMSPDERDDFTQNVMQAQYTRLVGTSATLMAQAYYNGAKGWFRIWDGAHTDLQQYGLRGHAFGAVLGATYERGRLALNWGAHLSFFTRDHFMDVVSGPRAYDNTGRKDEADSFLKAAVTTGRAQWWADAQVRYARFRYEGDQPLGAVSWRFFNPKAGVRLHPASTLTVFGSVGRMSREPARSDMLAGEDNASLPYDLRAVKPERVTDVEAGVEWSRRNLVVRGGAYAMEFRNEIALTGELSEIGLPVRRNVGQSSRRGVEFDVRWTPTAAWRVTSNATFSRNRIAAWTQYYDVYDAAGEWIGARSLVHSQVQPLLSPATILNGVIGWTPDRDLGLDVSGRWASTSQLDNTGNTAFRTPSFFMLDAQASVGFSRWFTGGRPRLRIQLTNLLNNRRAWPGGYSYLFFTREAPGRETLSGTSYYFPLATRSVYVTLDWRF
jgi:iron complex outermembrane receptor protein